MKQLKEKMLEEAKKFGNIGYCGKAKSWNECFTVEDGHLMLWFNVGANTKVLRTKLTDYSFPWLAGSYLITSENP